MANIVNLDRVSKAYGTTGPLLVDVSIGLDDDARVGVVGLNGAGKSTLLRILTRSRGAGQRPGDAPARPARCCRCRRRCCWTARRPSATSCSAPPGCRPSMGAEHEWAGDAGVRTVLDGLGMSYLGLDSPVATMSGGERRRVALAALLIRSSDLLVLDEPTNHLDVAGVAWLAQHLLKRRGALVVVTHDRWFLDAVCTITWEVADETVRVVRRVASPRGCWPGPSAQRVATETEARRQNLLRKEIAWLRRGAAGPDVEAEVPDRRGERADRRRAADPGHGDAREAVHRPARPAGLRPERTSRCAAAPRRC